MVQDQLIHIHRLKQIHSMEVNRAKGKAELGSSNDISPDALVPVSNEGESSPPPPALVSGAHLPSPAMDTSKTTTEPDANHSTNNNNNNNNNDKKANRRTRRRLSWRNLLNPSYKSKSDSFYKIFCDTIPKSERLIADYSCALHREILIQGRLYISVNYVAFYSNLFSWVTKLVIHLRDVIEIRKTNTARFIPNAIQLVCSNGEKHVFASFVARDKSHSMISKLWRNNLSCELSSGDMRALVHMNYGKDLGMSDNEELSINSPDRVPPEGSSDLVTPPRQRLGFGFKRPKSYSLSGGDTAHRKDLNNNGSPPSNDNNIETSKLDRLRNHWLSSPTLASFNQRIPLLTNSSPLARRLKLNNNNRTPPDTDHDNRLSCSFSPERFRRRSLLDFGRQTGRVDQNQVIDEVVVKLNELREFSRRLEADGELASVCNSSPVILGTPLSIRAHSTCSSSSMDKPAALHDESNERSTSSIQWLPGSTGGDTSSILIEESLNEKEEEEEEEEEAECEPAAICTEKEGPCQLSTTELVPPGNQTRDGDEIPVEECCECLEHRGKVLADQVFRMNVDELFELLFVNADFMRNYGETTGGVSNYKAGPWLAGSNLEELPEPQLEASRTLNYSMSINHVWAKRVQVEEVQRVCRLQRGRLYQLVTRSVNSGVPYSETFTMGLSYLLTAAREDISRSRLLVQSVVIFNKDKASWRLNMVKPMIERQSLSGVTEFINGLTSCIGEHIGAGGRLFSSAGSSGDVESRHPRASSPATSSVEPRPANNDRVPWTPERIRAKSRLKEKKLRSMYRYYLREANEASGGGGGGRTRADSPSSTLSSLSSFLEGSCVEERCSLDANDRVSLLVNSERADADANADADQVSAASGVGGHRLLLEGDKEHRLQPSPTGQARAQPQAPDGGLKSGQLATLLIIVLWGAVFCSHMLIMSRLDALEARWAALEDIWREQRH